MEERCRKQTRGPGQGNRTGVQQRSEAKGRVKAGSADKKI